MIPTPRTRCGRISARFANPISWTARGARKGRRSRLGADTDEVLPKLGYTTTEIEVLRAQKGI